MRTDHETIELEKILLTNPAAIKKLPQTERIPTKSSGFLLEPNLPNIGMNMSNITANKSIAKIVGIIKLIK